MVGEITLQPNPENHCTAISFASLLTVPISPFKKQSLGVAEVLGSVLIRISVVAIRTLTSPGIRCHLVHDRCNTPATDHPRTS